ncbi:AzlD domain-containing protein [Kocuria turfanensis]|uniref:AzlD domain-containing protein n=1 Tax=Kocuria turfanensis TaxID=388357 RepID=UPI00403626D1
MSISWVLVVAGGISWVLHVTFASAVPPDRLPAWFSSSLDYAAPAVMAALVAGALSGETGFAGMLTPTPLLVSAAVAAVVSWRTGGLGRTLVCAVVTYAVVDGMW